MEKEYKTSKKSNFTGWGYEKKFSPDEHHSSKNPLKIGYFADGAWSHEAFKKLISDNAISIQFICARYGTKDKTLADFSKSHNIAYLVQKDINSKEFIDNIKKYNCDLFVSMSFDQIFKSDIINLPKYKSINCHAGKLPSYKGRNILNWVLINDEKEFGITVHYIDEEIDTGDIILQNSYPINDDETYKTLLEKAHFECANILFEAINRFKSGIPFAVSQKSMSTSGFYCSQRKDGDEILKWNQTSREIFNFVRAICHPAPMARSMLNGVEMKINRVELIENSPGYKGIAGAILRKEKYGGFLVKTGDSFVRVVEFEYSDKFKVGDRFEIE